jgi:hypothetical protein
MKSTQERLSEVYSRLSDENREAEKQQLREAAALAGYYGCVSLTHSYFGGLPKPSEYTFRTSVNGMIRGEAGKYFEDESKGRGKTEIPVSHFIDLLNDSIVSWRLVNDGFNTMCGIVHTLELRPVIDGETVVRKITVITDTEKVYLNDGPTNVTTYTDLLTLIRLIG